MAITFHPDGRVEGTGAANFGSSGNIIQTVVGTNGYRTDRSGLSLTGSVTSPTFLDDNCKVTITPQRSNSKILLTWSAQIRLNPSSYGHVGVWYSPNSNMSSPTVIEKSHGPNNNLHESYRTVQNDHYMFHSWSRIAWDETVSNTNTRYYNVAGWAAAGTLTYGDNGLACQLMAQEIAV